MADEELDLETVRAKAKELGVKYHPAQKAETIQKNIDKFQANEEPDEDDEDEVDEDEPEDEPEEEAPKKKGKKKSSKDAEEETPAAQLERMRREVLTLIPVTVTSMDPQDAAVTAVVVSVGNSLLGQISKAIPFGFKWYMPKILVDQMADQLFARTAMVAAPGAVGGERVNTQWIKKYSIEYHPMPTQKELDDLAKAQAVGNELAK